MIAVEARNTNQALPVVATKLARLGIPGEDRLRLPETLVVSLSRPDELAVFWKEWPSYTAAAIQLALVNMLNHCAFGPPVMQVLSSETSARKSWDNVSLSITKSPGGYIDWTANFSSMSVWEVMALHVPWMSYMQQFIAATMRAQPGRMVLVMDAAWEAEAQFEKYKTLVAAPVSDCPYGNGGVESSLIDFHCPQRFLRELRMVIEEDEVLGIEEPWIRRVAFPIVRAEKTRLGNLDVEGDRNEAVLNRLSLCTASDIKAASIWKFVGKGAV